MLTTCSLKPLIGMVTHQKSVVESVKVLSVLDRSSCHGWDFNTSSRNSSENKMELLDLKYYLRWCQFLQWVKQKSVRSDSAIPRTIQSMEFSSPEYWSGWPFPSSGDLPNPGLKPRSPALQADSLPAEPRGKPSYAVLLYALISLVGLECTHNTFY